MNGFGEFLATPIVGPTYTDLAHEVDALKERLAHAEEVLRLRQSGASRARQQAFLELAEELAAMSPEQRDRHIRRIIDRHGDNP